MADRQVTRVVEPRTIMEGAGVRVRRTIGIPELRELNPFVLLDHFGAEDPEEYKAGFPLHMHRGVQTFTYMLIGSMTHEDDSGGRGKVGPGGAQLMTAGRGIRHSEMPEPGEGGAMSGLQLWFVLPPSERGTAPRYEGVPADQVPEITTEDGATVRVVAGTLNDTRGPITGVVVDARYLDIRIPAGTSYALPMTPDHSAIAYIIDGAVTFGEDRKKGTAVNHHELAVLGAGDHLRAIAHESGVRFILVSAQPID